MPLTSSIPAAIDYLIVQAAALPAFAAVPPDWSAPAIISDGWTPERGDRGLIIGITPEDDETEAAPVWAAVGAQSQWEIYNIPCILWASLGGSDMRAARNAAFALYDALNALILGDVSLGGALDSGAAILANIRVAQTGAASAAGEGRQCEIRFDVACRHRLAA